MDEVLYEADDLTPQHLEWLVQSRNINQRSALQLFGLFAQHPKRIMAKGILPKTQSMVAACFSLWRALFLADKTGKRKAVLTDAKTFLGKILTDDAIGYPQDRATREWTFNYYMNNTKLCLLSVSENWPEVKDEIENGKKGGPRLRWDRYQKAFELTLKRFETSLKKKTFGTKVKRTR